MPTHRIRMLIGLALAGGAAALVATPQRNEPAAIQAFDRRVGDYVALHRRLEGPLPPLSTTDDVREIRAAMDALAVRIQSARKGAREGDLFTADVAVIFRKRIASCLSPEEIDAILRDREEDDPEVVPPFRVNAAWPEGMPFNLVPPALIAALPPLPPELQYRIIGRSLILWDHHSNLIVDVLPGAFPT